MAEKMAIEPDWQGAIEKVRPYVVRIRTPSGSGTGFLFAYSSQLCGVATAAHVVDYAYWWELPIRVDHHSSGETTMLRHGQRAILINKLHDSAALIFPRGQLPFPPDLLELVPEGKFLRVGNPIGWLGFPAVSPDDLCFFLGTASCWQELQHSYLVDGVAINGVSGGPAFGAFGDSPLLVGAMTAYMPNRATGETLPGLSIVRDLKHAQEVVRQLRNLDEAKEKETAEEPAEPPASLNESGGT